MALSIAARRVDGVQGARCPKGSAEMAALSVPRARTFESNLPPDEEYGRDGRTRCAAEIRSATNTLAQTSMIIRCFKTETSALLTPRAARRHGRCVRDAYRARAAASVVTPPRQSHNWLPTQKEPSPAQGTNRSSVSRGRWTKRRRAATTTPPKRASTSKIR